MTIHKLECVALKQRGAKYVAQLLAGKTKQAHLDFWQQLNSSVKESEVLVGYKGAEFTRTTSAIHIKFRS